MGGEDGHAHPGQLGRMDEIGPDPGRGVQDRHHLDAGLQELIAHDDADVAGAHHQYPIAGTDAVHVHQRLHGAGAVDAGEIVVGEGQELFKGAGGADDGPGPDLEIVLLVLQHGDHVVLVEANSGGVEQDLDPIPVGFDLLEKDVGDVHAPMGGVLALGAEEHMGLLDELSAGLEAALQDKHPGAGGSRRDGGAKTRGTGPDDEQFHFFHLSFPFPSWVSTVIPSRRSVMQVRTLGSPSTTI